MKFILKFTELPGNIETKSLNNFISTLQLFNVIINGNFGYCLFYFKIKMVLCSILFYFLKLESKTVGSKILVFNSSKMLVRFILNCAKCCTSLFWFVSLYEELLSITLPTFFIKMCFHIQVRKLSFEIQILNLKTNNIVK